jgi:hypothetical protein
MFFIILGNHVISRFSSLQWQWRGSQGGLSGARHKVVATGEKIWFGL